MFCLNKNCFLNEKHITDICSLDKASISLKRLKDKGCSYKIINLSGVYAASTCIYTSFGILFLTSYSESLVLKKIKENQSDDLLLKCGNGNFISEKNTLLVIDAEKNVCNKMMEFTRQSKKLFDFTQGKKTKSYILTTDYCLYKSPMNPETTSRQGRKIKEKNKKNQILLCSGNAGCSNNAISTYSDDISISFPQ